MASSDRSAPGALAQEDLSAILARSRPALARAVSRVENERTGAAQLLAALTPHLGKAHVVGITGAPGAGKSTLINALLGALSLRGRHIAVVAVDPSSPVSGGALLGDRVRMDEHGAGDNVFIRSLSARGHLGGVSRTTEGVVDVFDAAGFDIVLIETVGVGQSEIEVSQLADTRIVMCAPGLGDEVQAIKAGILEIADILVVSKGDAPGAAQTRNDLHTAARLRHADGPPPTVVTTAVTTAATPGSGIDELVDLIDAHARSAGIGRRLLARSAPDDANQAVVCVQAPGVAASSAAAPAPHASDEALFEAVDRWRSHGMGVALATVVRTWGSSPRPQGSLLAVAQDGAFVGSVSGGCIETAVITAALEVISNGVPQQLEYGVSDARAWEVGLACGGRVQVYVERMKAERFERILACRRARQPVALVTRLADGAQALVDNDDLSGELTLDAAQLDETRERLRADRSGPLDSAAGLLFARCHTTLPRLVVIGAVHITQALAPMAAIAGFEVLVVDPRRAFAHAERLPGVSVSGAWPDEALARIGLDAQTAVVALSHDPKLDDPALIAALRSAAFYVGALGSTRTHAQRIERLKRAGLGAATERIHAPIGLNLGGRSPAEIAVAILAQIIQVRHAGAVQRQRAP